MAGHTYLRDLDDACVLLQTSKKVGERKNALERMFQLINIEAVRKSLHSDTRGVLDGSSREDSRTWGNVFDAVCQMVMLELHHAKTKYENSVKKGVVPKNNLVRADVERALRRVIEVADEDGPINFRSIGTILDHVHRVLTYMEVITEQFLPEYIKLLCENILGVSSYCFMLFPSKCKRLLSVFLNLLQSSFASGSVLPSLLGRAILSILRAFPYEFTGVYPMIHEFIVVILGMGGTSTKADVHVLRLLNYTALQVAASMPQGVRELGKRFSGTFIKNWQRSRDHLLKYEIAMFFRIQLSLNVFYTGVPMGTDWLDDVFDLIRNDDNWSTGDVLVSIVDLMADVIFHLSHSQRTLTHATGRADKKRRTHDVWEEFLGPLCSAGRGPLLQRDLRLLKVLDRIVEKYPLILPPATYERLVSTLNSVIDIAEGMREDDPVKLLCRLAALKRVPQSTECVSPAANVWQDIWRNVMKGLPPAGVPSTDRQIWRAEHCLRLLADILRHGRVEVQFVLHGQATLWESPCFTEPSCRSIAAVELLVVFLSHYELDDSEANKMPRREKLLTWLLFPVTMEEKSPATVFTPTPEMLSSAVVGLVQPGVPRCADDVANERWRNPLLLERQVEPTSKDESAHFGASETALRAIVLGRDLYDSTRTDASVTTLQFSRNNIPFSMRVHLLRSVIQLMKDRNSKCVDYSKNVSAHHRRTLGVDVRGVSKSVVESATHMRLIVRLLRSIDPVESVIPVDFSGTMLTLFKEITDLAVSGMEELGSSASGLIPSIQALAQLFPLCSAPGKVPDDGRYDAKTALSLQIAIEPLIECLLDGLSRSLRMSTAPLSLSNDNTPVPADDFEMEDMDVIGHDDFDGGGRKGARVEISCLHELITAVGSLTYLGTVASDSPQFLQVGQLFADLLDAPIPSSCKFELLQWLLSISTTAYDAKAAEYIREFLRKKTEWSGDGVVRRNILRLLSAVGPSLLRRSIDHDEARSAALDDCKDSMRYFLDLCKRKSSPRLNWKTRLCFAKCLRAFITCDEGDEASEIEDAFMGLLADPNFYVRTYMSKAIVLLFELWTADEAIFADIFHNNLVPLLPYSDPTTEEERFSAEAKEVTALLTLGEIACVSIRNESKILFQLCATSVGREAQILELVSFIIVHVASSLGYPSAQALIADHIGGIMQSWAESEHLALLDFPVQICGFASIEDFLTHHASQIVPRMVLIQSAELVDLVSSTLRSKTKRLIESHFAAIFGYTFPIRYSDELSGEDRFTGFVGGYLGAQRVDELIPEQFDEILLCMLGSLSFDERVTAPSFEPKCIKAVMDHLVKSFKKRSVSELMLPEGECWRVANLILRLNEMVACAQRAHQKVRHFRAIVFLLELLGAHACRFALIRDMIYSALRFISDHTLFPWVCRLLLLVVRVSIRHKPSVLVSGGHDHVCVIIPAIERFASASPESHSTILDILEALLACSDANVRDAVFRLDPLSGVAIFDVFNSNRQQLTVPEDQLTLLDRINSFIRKVDTGHEGVTCSLPHVMWQREAALRSMDQVLSGEKAKIVGLLTKASNAANFESPERVCVENLSRVLVRLCHAKHGEAIRMLAGKCLGHLGTLDPDAIQVFSFSHNSPDDTNDAVVGTAKVRGLLYDRYNYSSLCIQERAIRLLGEYMNDPDVKTAKLAVDSVRKILATPSGAAAFTHLSTISRRALSAYLASDRLATMVTVHGAFVECFLLNTIVQGGQQLHIAEPDARLHSEDTWSMVGKSHSDWISKLSYALGVRAVSDEVLKNCASMCLVKVEFAELMFPYFVLDAVLQDTATRVGGASMLSVTLAKRVQMLLASPGSSTDALKLLLSTLDFLRMRVVTLQRDRPPSEGNRSKKRSSSRRSSHVRFWDNSFWREIALLDVADAAVRCQSFVTALTYVEYWCEKECGDLILPGDVAESASAHSSVPSPEVVSKANSLLLDIFSNVDDPDCLYALQRLQSVDVVLKRYEHEGNWLSAVGTYDMLLQDDINRSTGSLSAPARPELHRGLLNALSQLGFSALSNLYLRGFAARDPTHFAGLSEHQYESAWRTRQWDVGGLAGHHGVLDAGSETEHLRITSGGATPPRPLVVGFHHGAYQVLKALENGDRPGFSTALAATRFSLVQDIGSSSFETSKRVYPALARLQFLEEVEAVWKIRWGSPQSDGSVTYADGVETMAGTFRTWQLHHNLLKQQFSLIEPILAVEMTLLNMLDLSTEDREVLVFELLLAQSKFARRAGRNHLALSALNKLSHFRIPEVEMLTVYHSARVFWNQGEEDRAIHAVKDIIKRVDAKELHIDDPKLYAKVILFAGKWIAARGAERSDVIKSYLEKAIWEHVKYDGANAGKAFLTLARFSDAQHTAMSSRLTSREFKASQKLRQQAEKELRQVQTLEKNGKISQDMRRHKVVLEKQVDIDKQEQTRMESDIAQTLESAMKNYLECLSRDDEHDIRVPFRLCSLWFTNAYTEEVNQLIESKLKVLQIRKFLPLIYQIVSRLSSAKTTFQRVLKKFIYRMIVQYPHHCVWQILALKNSGVSQSGKPVPDAYQDRANAAEKLLRQCKMKKSLEKLINQMEELSNAYISLAMQRLPDKLRSRPGAHKITNDRILSVRSLTHVVMPTLDLPSRAIDVTKDGEFPYVVGFHPEFTLHGGINLPKAIYCLGSNGKRYKQLVKGNDDLRQDAVMQQIFNVVNRLLSRDRETRHRRLTVRSYQIIPLSPHAGLLEWVGNSMPLSQYLIGKNTDPRKAAHARFRPADMPHRECRKKLDAASQATKLATFIEIAERFKPVFHHFFLEKFSEPSEWFARRLAYTRSVASNSIVGHIVGLGDRHSTNILIDLQSAELVHIDLGVAFEQGMTLRHPELVPFRLTRDIVDGMGVTGVEGVFRRCCEKTLKVLRENHELIITILEVFMHDPLYKWTLSPLKALRLQRQTVTDLASEDGSPTMMSTTPESAGNKHTERTLLRVKAKLLGYDSDERLNIEGQVQRLITEARDPTRLSKMFVGWAPWV